MAEHAAHLRPRPVAGRDACTRSGQPSGSLCREKNVEEDSENRLKEEKNHE